MPQHRLFALVITVLLVTASQAQPPGTAVVRCGNTYTDAPCPGGRLVAADDARSAAQQRQAHDVAKKDAAMANNLAAERRGREQAAVGQLAARIGPATRAADAAKAKQAKLPTPPKAPKAPKTALGKPKLSKGKPLASG